MNRDSQEALQAANVTPPPAVDWIRADDARQPQRRTRSVDYEMFMTWIDFMPRFWFRYHSSELLVKIIRGLGTAIADRGQDVRYAMWSRFACMLLPLALLGACEDISHKIRLTGSGASFPYPIYSTWFKAYRLENPDVLINYQAKGSGAGIRDFINGTVDFAGSDAAMTDAEIAEVDGGVVMIPITAGEIVVAYNLPGFDGPLRLARDVYPRIFLGEIERWNDPAIARSNPDIPLPDLPITVVRRADSSGTTFAFTNHLSAVSPRWRSGPGTGKTVVWADTDKILAAPKNDGVTATIRQTPGAIGYIEYGYAKFGSVPMAMLENRAGNFVLPGTETGKAALEGAELPEDLRVWIPDPSGDAAYPIVTYSWLLLRRRNDDERIAAALKALVASCLTNGQQRAEQLGYVPLPEDVVRRALAALETIS